ncbi:MAG: protein kinase [Deltaproteobacteria bacterium]|nr:protein kinase [Deltaproteobacteria bacterium]
MSDELDHEFVDHRRFAIRRRIGAGGMGVVYHAYDRERGHDVALKTLKVFAGAHLYRLKREFRALADVSHPNLVTLHELFSERDLWFLTMELVRGSNFLEHVWRTRPTTIRSSILPLSAEPVSGFGPTVRRSVLPKELIDDEATTAHATETPLPGTSLDALLHDELSTEAMHRSVLARADPDRLRDALRQLAIGVSALHGAGKLHRDIKPSNVLVTPAGRLVLLDFGLVTDLGPDTLKSLTREGFAGTLAYMAPEQSSGKPATPAADWYSVGVVLYEALTGRLPFEGNGVEMLIQRLQKRPPPPSEQVSDVPEDLDLLATELLAPAPEERPAGREILSRLGASMRSPSTFVVPDPEGASKAAEASGGGSAFVGRNRHLASLEDAFSRMLEGRAIFVHVKGPAGVGKTALVRRFLTDLRARESAVVLAGRCHERESLPLKAVDVIVDSLSQYLARLPRREASSLLPRGTAALCRLFPVLERVEAAVSVVDEELPRDRAGLEKRAITALREILSRIGDRAPLVLLVDDLQWGDLESLEAFTAIFAPPEPPRVLFVACSRAEEEKRSPVLAALAKDRQLLAPDSRQVALQGLSFDESRDLALTLFGASDAAAFEKAEQIAREARGSPLFVETMVKHALREVSPGTDELRLDAVLRARLSKLSPEARRMLEVVAIQTKALPEKVVGVAAGLRAEDEQPVLTTLKASSFVRTARADGVGTVELYHARVAEAVLGELPEETLRARHLALARALETAAPNEAETIHAHFHSGRASADAARWAIKAGDEASKMMAFGRAVSMYRAALIEQELGELVRLETQEKLAMALVGSSQCAEAGAAYLELAKARSGAISERYLRQAGQSLLISGHVDQGLEILSQQLAKQGEKLPEVPRKAFASKWLRSAQLWQRGLSFEHRREGQLEADAVERVDTLGALAKGLFLVDFGRGVELAERYLLAALRLGEPGRVLEAVTLETCYSSAIGLKPERRQQLEELARRLATELDTPYARAVLGLAEGVAAHLSGDARVAMVRFEESEALLQDQCAGAAFELAVVRTFLHGALFFGGRLQALARRVSELTDDADTRMDLLAATELRIGYPNAIWLVADNPERAIRVAGEAMSRFGQSTFTTQKYFALLARVNALIYSGQGVEALQAVKAAWSELKTSDLLRTKPVLVSARHLRARAAIAEALETHDSAPLELAEHDAKTIAKERIPWADPLVTLIRAGIASAAGDRSKAAAQLELSLPALADAGQLLFARAARLWVGRLGIGAPNRELAETAELELRDEGVRNPVNFALMLIPGRMVDPNESA